jgi:uncharacterized protein YdeI (YjbR/CyaY-like superfamily)
VRSSSDGGPARPTHPTPDDVRQRLVDTAVMHDFEGRPRYQRNDYLGWIAGAKRPETREKRIAQMVTELGGGGVYMKMAHPPSRKR